MEKIEFYQWEGEVRYRSNGVERVLCQNDREIIEFVLKTLEYMFPDALKALNEECEKSKANKWYYDFRRVELFVRCNFSEHDTLKYDIDDGVMNFEEVKCPLRGICKNEGVICKPKIRVNLPKAEGNVALLYSRGMNSKEIAVKLKKTVKTVKNQLDSARKRLRLRSTKDIVRLFSIYNGFIIFP